MKSNEYLKKQKKTKLIYQNLCVNLLENLIKINLNKFFFLFFYTYIY